MKNDWQRPSFREAIAEYGRITTLEIETTARLVGTLYATMDRFDSFKVLALLYFAAVSFSETARRLGKPNLAKGFLLSENAPFSRLLKQSCQLAGSSKLPKGRGDLERIILQGIEPFDVAGLTDPSRHPWYPALTADLLHNAGKLGACREEMNAMIRRCFGR